MARPYFKISTCLIIQKGYSFFTSSLCLSFWLREWSALFASFSFIFLKSKWQKLLTFPEKSLSESPFPLISTITSQTDSLKDRETYLLKFKDHDGMQMLHQTV